MMTKPKDRKFKRANSKDRDKIDIVLTKLAVLAGVFEARIDRIRDQNHESDDKYKDPDVHQLGIADGLEIAVDEIAQIIEDSSPDDDSLAALAKEGMALLKASFATPKKEE